jgi:putative FmdB family regulatory protein
LPTYDYFCQKCDANFDVIESIREYTGSAPCPRCQTISEDRVISAAVHFTGTKIEDREFNHGLGIVTKNARHRKDEARARGLEEIGTEPTQKMHEKEFKDRAERHKRRWDEV